MIAIDPGNENSAAVLFIDGKPIEWFLDSNAAIRNQLRKWPCTNNDLVIEYTPPYSMQSKSGRAYVPSQVVMTAIEIGRFVQLWKDCTGKEALLLSRMEVKKHLLGRATGNDTQVRDAILSRYGGTREKAVGRKANRGPLYGFKKDLWAALAVALTWSECPNVATIERAI